jgi:thiamine-phosphate pyrophosphorylase
VPVPAPRLYLIADRLSAAQVARALEGVPDDLRGTGAVVVSLRDKALDGRALTSLARALREATARAGVRLFINDRLDVALTVGADGVHLGGRSLTPALVARLAPALAVAVSTHSRDEIAAATCAPNVAFCVFGPVYDTPSKRALGSPVGLAALRDAADQELPVLALGGVTPGRAPDCVAAGAVGLACIRAVWEAPDPARAVCDFLGFFPTASALAVRRT